ncbi:MAG: hypothetical protein M3R04_00205 [bacterium]|nr:hypothetical protein [bacterium]
MRNTICTAFALAAALLLANIAFAADSLLSHDDGKADTYEKLATDGHLVQLNSPGWDHTFTEQLQIYGYRFGNVGNTLGTVVIWDTKPVPRPDKPPRKGEKAPPTKVAHIIVTRQFPLTDAPEKAGWFNVALDPTVLPRSFNISVFTRSSESAGLWVGLTAKDRQTFSSAGIIKDIAEATRVRLRRDGRDWMIRLRVRDSLEAQGGLSLAQLSGKNFSAFDDGSADGFATSQSNGPMVRFSNNTDRRLKRVHVHGKLAGTAWFNSDRMAGVWILDEDYGILCRGNLAFKNYTNVASWASVDLPDIMLPRTFYVVVEPVSRPAAQLLIGYDSSSANRASLFGTAGAVYMWSIEAPEEKTNWMIRVEYRWGSSLGSKLQGFLSLAP